MPVFPHPVYSLFFYSGKFSFVHLVFLPFIFLVFYFVFRSFLIFLKKYKQKTKASGLGVVNFFQKTFDSTTIFER